MYPVRGTMGTPQCSDCSTSTSTTNAGKAVRRKSPAGLVATIRNDDRPIASAWRTRVAKPNVPRTRGAGIAMRAGVASGAGGVWASHR
jgi:hypothetical protein